MTSKSIQAIRGMSDILPDEAHLWDYFEDTVRDWLKSYGYRNIRMPIVEKTELFARSIGEATDIVEKEMYTFVDGLNGDSLTLRPEATASCVRAVIENNLLYNGPQRLYYTGPMFRHERPQKGRYRQFHQVGVEAFGFTGPDMDTEHIIMCARLWRRLGLADIDLQINSLGNTAARLRHREKLIQYLERNTGALDQDAHRRLHSNPLRILDSKNPAMQELIQNAPRLLDDLDDESLKHFNQLQEWLKEARIEFEINPRLVRGLDYYNRTVFEWGTTQLGAQGTLCAGGRYDSLVEQFGGKPTPACGFAMGIERLLMMLREGAATPAEDVPHAYLAHHGETAGAMALGVAEKLRDGGLRVVLHCGGGGFKAQMKKADASGARYAVIIGEDEAKAGAVSVKPLREPGEQALVKLSELSGLITRLKE